MPQRQAEIQAAMGEWLQSLAPWDVFATWTFSRLVTVNGAAYWAERILKQWQKMAATPIYAFWGVEAGNIGGLVHLHALVGNVAQLKEYCGVRLSKDEWGRGCCLLHSWPAGYSRVLRYDPNQGAGYYVSKYCVKEFGEWQLFGFPAVPQGASR